MSIHGVYRRMPVYLAVPLALLASAVITLTFAFLDAIALDFILGKFYGPGDLGNGILVFFFAAPSIAIFGFVSCFSLLASRDLVARSDIRVCDCLYYGLGVGRRFRWNRLCLLRTGSHRLAS